jgi:hypothetical protein
MVALMYLKLIWQSRIILQVITTITNMVVGLRQSWKALLNGQIGIFFTSYLKDMLSEIYWII